MRLELTLPALERLIAGESEITLELRKQIVQEFSKRHLKEVAESASYQAAIDVAKRVVNEAAKEAFDIDNLATNMVLPAISSRLKSMLESFVQKTAQQAADNALANIVKYQQHYWSRELTEMIRKAMDRQIEQEIEDGIRRRLEAAKDMERIPPSDNARETSNKRDDP